MLDQTRSFKGDIESMAGNIQSILTKEGLPPPEKVGKECTAHVADGHNYDDPNNVDEVFMTCRCSICGKYYTVSKNTGLEIK